MPFDFIQTTPQDGNHLLHVFKSVCPINEHVEAYIRENIYSLKLKKGKKLHQEGEICEMIYFIKKGAVRGYIKEGKKDTTTWITVENELVAPIYSFIKQVPSIENMETLEDSHLLMMSHRDMNQMYVLFPETNLLARCLYEKYYADAEVRALTARISKAEKKYEYFLKAYGHLANRIPLTYIASFLSVSLETLSRVRSKMRKIN